ncbi:type II toxin-antitoxin system death-on-curing family toxin [Pseudoalteromonas sp. JB197]|uniref:type II toxin-antitoxin system death-on-curing family toxin n=1 Tax=Pseudoalteromonas sp. JB197 TaxID=1434839 RepID=UPI00097E83BC|nr:MULTISPECIES: type II toxin-antitoxin system death-on-curing family toxin [unclassified Pseudoalteromonas]PCC10688.1 type II toxin-antitoxin system death-on-curing family toxin [Pseudoalteromonas sp. JB197]SJN37444.1 Death on curing protein, Doc toxin [Pseudoalteromonas sp. JB197]|tara:strand:+ start:78 stop:809 length:732 start_codon:yes stop_codon:yes gene_type:complete
MNTDTVIKIHEYLTEYFQDSEDPISPPGIKDLGLLDSAVARKDMTGGSKDIFEGVFNKSAALFHGIISNHSFYNGNKRAALMSTLVYLGENGYWVTKCTDAEMFEFTRKIAAHELDKDRNKEIVIIADWLKTNSRRREIRDKMLNFNELRHILSNFNYEVEISKNNCCDITKNGKFITSIRYKGNKGSEDYDVKYVKGLRRRLKLTPEYGVDSLEFYSIKGVSDTLNKYMKVRHNVMRWLAKI